MSKNFDKLNKYLQKAAAYTSVLNLIDYDSNVNAPADSDMYTSKVTGIISNDYHDIFTDKGFNTLLDKCKKDAEKGKLTAVEKSLVKEAVKKGGSLLQYRLRNTENFQSLLPSLLIYGRGQKGALHFRNLHHSLKRLLIIRKNLLNI